MSSTGRFTKEIEIPLSHIRLKGFLHVKPETEGLVVFAHGSGSGRHSSRNQYVARALQNAGLGTLLFDLLSEEEEEIDNRTRQLRFDIPLLASRLVGVTDWLARNYRPQNLQLGYFGASTGAGAALIAAAERPELIRAVVSRGGRPDLAHKYLSLVEAPTLLIVGEMDGPVIEMNRSAEARMTNSEVQLSIVPGASHLFEEAGTLDEVAALATRFFRGHLIRSESEQISFSEL